MKKALLITYYWPPGGGAGVHRWLRMSKYFAENGYELTVFHPENAAYSILDDKLQEQVAENIKTVQGKIIEPAQFLSEGNSLKSVGFASEKKFSPLQKLMIRVRGNFFIPDARMLWIRPSVKKLSKLQKEQAFDTVISTGPPHSTHIIAQKLKKRFNLHWVADFRDPWTGIDFFEDLQIGKAAFAKHRRMEKQVLAEADEVITVSDNCKIELEGIVNREVRVITNGFDFKAEKNQVQTSEKFTIAHFGTMTSSRNPSTLWEVLGEKCKVDADFNAKLEICLFGVIDAHVIDGLKSNGLESKLVHIEKVPHHESVLKQQQMQVLLLVVNRTGNVKGIVTGKVFEYLNAQRPILAIGPEEGDLAEIVRESSSGEAIHYDDKTKLKKYVSNCFEKYQNKELYLSERDLSRYSTQALTKKFCEFLP